MKYFVAASYAIIATAATRPHSTSPSAAAPQPSASGGGVDVVVSSSSSNNYTVTAMTYGANTPSYIQSDFVQREGAAMVLFIHPIHSVHSMKYEETKLLFLFCFLGEFDWNWCYSMAWGQLG